MKNPKNSRKKGSTISQYVYKEIKADIINSFYKPGTHLDEIGIGKRFRVSRTPIRAAMNRLESEGLISSIPHKGFTVQKLSVQEFHEIGIVREMLEGYAAEIAAKKLTEEDMGILKNSKQQFEALIKKDSFNDNILELHNELDFQLHSLILRICGNVTIELIIKNLRDKIQQIRFTATPDRLKSSILEHIKITNALINRDSEASQKAMIDHLKALRKDLYSRW